jgi:DNA-binding NarL/FixJ family response regulator
MLSRREMQVLRFANLGFSNKLIGHTLGLSGSSVSKYLERARKKLEAARPFEAVSSFAVGRRDTDVGKVTIAKAAAVLHPR